MHASLRPRAIPCSSNSSERTTEQCDEGGDSQSADLGIAERFPERATFECKRKQCQDRRAHGDPSRDEYARSQRPDAAVDSAATRVFFGATVTYKDAASLEYVVSIVGIDEVDLERGYISWRSPLANALMEASPGDRVDLRAPAKTEHLEIIDLEEKTLQPLDVPFGPRV